MLGVSPGVFALFCVMFIALGIYNILMARRRQRQTHLQGQNVVWYKQIGVLTGIEYILLALAFLMTISISYHWLPIGLNAIVLPFYLVVLLSSGLLAGMVIYQGINNSRRLRRADPVQSVQDRNTTRTSDVHLLSPEERAARTQKHRERRQKAAAARRRRAGKA